MSITDELRDWVSNHYSGWPSKQAEGFAIADRIDEIYEKSRSDTDATDTQHDVASDVDEILEHVINANMLSMPYDVYSELFDAVDGLGVEIENLQSQNTKLREMLAEDNEELAKMWRVIYYLYSFAKTCGVDAEDMRELGVEVSDG